jgi:hypothetical protein
MQNFLATENLKMSIAFYERQLFLYDRCLLRLHAAERRGSGSLSCLYKYILQNVPPFYSDICVRWSYGKAKLSLCLTKHHAMKTYWGSGDTAPHILDHGPRWKCASRPGRFDPRERAPATHWIEGWVGPRAVLDTGQNKLITFSSCFSYLKKSSNEKKWPLHYIPS